MLISTRSPALEAFYFSQKRVELFNLPTKYFDIYIFCNIDIFS